jgi:cysteine synthase A
VVTVFSDDNKKYLSTDLLRKEPVKPDFLSTRIELLDVIALKRTCSTCCDGENCVDTTDAVDASGLSLPPSCPRRRFVI